MSKRTPGAWTVESDGTTVSMGGQCVIVAPAPDYRPQDQKANAALIAAAPEMAEALQALLACPAMNEDFAEVGTMQAYDLARIALHKAGVES